MPETPPGSGGDGHWHSRALSSLHLSSWVGALGLGAICLLAFALRSMGFEWVFVGDSDVILLVGDGQYHARRAFYTFANFPALLLHDSYINYPDGASIPDPPLLDFLVAAIARALSASPTGFERTIAWWSPVASALTSIPVYLGCRLLAGRGTAWTAAAIFAVLPIVVTGSQVGNGDHHAAVALLGALLLALSLAALSPASRPSRLRWVAVGFAILRIAIPLSWSGSLLYTGIADGLILLSATLSGRREPLAIVGFAAAGCAVVLCPVVLWLPHPVGGAYSAVALSYLHVLCALATSAVAAAAWGLERWWPGRSWQLRLVHLIAASAIVALLLLSHTELRRGLLQGFSFVGSVDLGRTATFELLPLFPVFGRPAGQPAQLYFGLFAYLIPVLPLVALLALRRAEGREPLLLLLAWASVLGVITLWQTRHGNEFAAPASIVLALSLNRVDRWFCEGIGFPRAISLVILGALCTVALWSPLRFLYLPKAHSSLLTLTGLQPQGDRALASPSGSLTRFLEEVRSVTPETSGYLDSDGIPEYGILCSPNIGHALHRVARRATAANGFQYLVGAENFRDAQRFYQLKEEAEAVRVAERLRARYAVTMFFPGIQRGTIEARLQLHDGASGAARLTRFRLVTEGPRGGVPLGDLFGFPRPRSVVPYKLFEIVTGAVLEARADPETPVSAILNLITPMGRRIQYRAAGRVGADGVARLTLPYPTEGVMPVHSIGPYHVRIGDAEQKVWISEAQVQAGSIIAVSKSQ